MSGLTTVDSINKLRKVNIKSGQSQRSHQQVEHGDIQPNKPGLSHNPPIEIEGDDDSTIKSTASTVPMISQCQDCTKYRYWLKK